MAKPLWDAMERYRKKEYVRGHTPGHSGHAAPLAPLASMLSYDLTEAEGLDSFFEASGPIAEAEALASRLFGSAGTVFSAGGCTLAIQAMLALAAGPGQTVIFGRNAHRSAVNTAALLDLRPVWALPADGRITPAVLEPLLKAHPDTAAVFITSPDYYGRLSPIGALSVLCRRYGTPLLVDNAHGTHLRFCGGLHPLEQGASMTADSAHKTLPALTGGAFLQVGDPAYLAAARGKMALFGSTSPSYPIMASLDLCRDWCEREGRIAFAGLAEKVGELRKLSQERGLPAEEGACDPVRLTLRASAAGYTGWELAKDLLENGVSCEFADQSRVVLILTPFHTAKELLRIEDWLRRFRPRPPLAQEKYAWGAVRQAMTPREALFAAGKRLAVEKAAGKVALEALCPCPPGIPVVLPGEILSADAAEALKNSGIFEIKVL